MRWLPLILALLAGCAKAPYSDYSHSANSGIALVLQATSDAISDNADLSATAAGIEKTILEHQARSLTTARNAALDTDKSIQLQTKAHWQFVRESRDRDHKAEMDHAANKWIGWETRRLWWLVVSIWAGLGAFGVIAGVIGWTPISASIFRFLPFSNPFALIRDRINAAKGPTVSVNIEGAPAGSVTTSPPILKPQLPPRKTSKKGKQQ